jgi:dinuclear metal center YbgI/SA1388 family protein
VSSPTLEQVVEALERRYPPSLAEEWDAVGLVCGRPEAVVAKVLFAVDPDPRVVAEALTIGADLIVTHHPLFLTPIHSVATATSGGSIIHDLIENGIALYAAHTNADSAIDGVSEALAHTLGVMDTRVLAPSADPGLGLGRWGRLAEPVPLQAFAEQVAAVLPKTAHGVRVSGNPEKLVSTVALCGGSGDSFLSLANSVGADVYLTADCKHHRLLDHRTAGGCAVIDVAHWASEWPWLPRAASLLVADMSVQGTTVEAEVSTIVTDPWTSHLESTVRSAP